MSERNPSRRLERTAIAPVPRAARKQSGTVRRPIRVLIIDDSADNRDIYAAVLASEGMHVLCAENGAVGLETARKTMPDLIVMDLDMPVMDGLQALRELKLSDRTRDIPVVVLSADAVRQHVRTTGAGCSASLAKPCRPEDLAGVVDALVEARRGSRSPTS